jgi:hypothetical protein
LPATIHRLGAARSSLNEALRDEGVALVSARDAVKTSGSASGPAARALRVAELAHARSNAAAGEVRVLSAQADRDGAAVEAHARMSTRPRTLSQP